MRASTSWRGRFQFSEEKAYKVRYGIWRSIQACAIARTDSAPALCPSTLGSPLCLAHRPLPSIMIAICWRGF